MKIKKIGLLTKENIQGVNMLETIKQTGVECYCSDLARLTGVAYNSSTGIGEYWLDAKCISTKKNKQTTTNMNYTYNGSILSTYKFDFKSGVRICFSFDDIEDFDLEKIDDLNVEYPLTVLGGNIAETIDKLFKNKNRCIIKTGRVHSVVGVEYPEYEVFGIKFIKMEKIPSSKLLSDGTTSNSECAYLKVESMPLIVDEKAKLVYASAILFGMPFDKEGREFSSSDLKQYLNGEFLKSINDELTHSVPDVLFGDEKIHENNRYGFNFNAITEEEIIEICINSNIAVFLHGKTGVGKTERMLTLDRNLEIIDFGCTSADGFTGIIAKDFNSKELVLYEPYWYKSLCEKCKAEPDKLHILFLEELTNAKSDVQKVAFEVTLNKTLTNSGFRLKLPENAVVCAAGNEASESRSANALSEPLFGRFAHVYIDTDSEAWLKWALKRKKDDKQLLYKKGEENNSIHPAIIDYIKINGDKVLRTKYDGIVPNADPRKWALASKALYQSNNPNVLRAFIGENLTQDFIKFCQMDLITIDDVLKDKCHVEDIPQDPSLRWYIVMYLSTVDDDNVDKVREFVRKLGKEFLAVFDYEWSKDNDERIIKLYTQENNQFVKRLMSNGNK